MRFAPIGRVLALATLALATLALAGAVPPAADALPKPKTLLKVATLAPEGSTWMDIMAEMDTAIRTATSNDVGLRFFPNMVQGDERTVLRKIRSGQLHGGALTGAGLGEIAPAIRVLELPFLFGGPSEVDAVHAALDAEFESLLDEKGFVLLGWAEVGPVYIFTNRPVASLEDMSGVKMWLWEGDPVAEEMFKTFDIPPIPLSIAHVMTSLQTGMVDGIYASPYGCIALQWFTRVRHMTEIPVAHATGALVVSKRAFSKVPEKHRPTVRRIAREHLARLVEATRRQNDEALTALEEQGVSVVSPDAAQLEGFRAEAREVWRALSGKLYDEEILSRVVAALRAYRASEGKIADTAG